MFNWEVSDWTVQLSERRPPPYPETLLPESPPQNKLYTSCWHNKPFAFVFVVVVVVQIRVLCSHSSLILSNLILWLLAPSCPDRLCSKAVRKAPLLFCECDFSLPYANTAYSPVTFGGKFWFNKYFWILVFRTVVQNPLNWQLVMVNGENYWVCWFNCLYELIKASQLRSRYCYLPL